MDELAVKGKVVEVYCGAVLSDQEPHQRQVEHRRGEEDDRAGFREPGGQRGVDRVCLEEPHRPQRSQESCVLF